MQVVLSVLARQPILALLEVSYPCYGSTVSAFQDIGLGGADQAAGPAPGRQTKPCISLSLT